MYEKIGNSVQAIIERQSLQNVLCLIQCLVSLKR